MLVKVIYSGKVFSPSTHDLKVHLSSESLKRILSFKSMEVFFAN